MKLSKSDSKAISEKERTDEAELKNFFMASTIEPYIGKISFPPEKTADLFFDLLINPLSNEDAFRFAATSLAQQNISLETLFSRYQRHFNTENLLSLRPRLLRTLFKYRFPKVLEKELIIAKPFRKAAPEDYPALTILLNTFVLYYGKESLNYANGDRKTLSEEKGNPEKQAILRGLETGSGVGSKFMTKLQKDIEIDEEVYQQYIENLYRKVKEKVFEVNAHASYFVDSSGKEYLMTWPFVTSQEVIRTPCLADRFIDSGSLVTIPK